MPAPFIGPRREQPGLRRGAPVRSLETVSFAFQMLEEERELDRLAVELARLGPELQVAERVAVPPGPPAVAPRPHDQSVRGAGPVLLEGVEQLERAGQVLGVVPAADEEHGRLDVPHVRHERAGLPEFVVSRVVQVVGPIGILALEVERLAVGERPHPEEEVIGVGNAPDPVHGPPPGCLRPARPRPEEPVEIEVRGQIEGSVVEGVVAVGDIPDGRLRRGRDERRVGVDHPERGEEPSVGDAPDSGPAVVARHVLDQPVDAVVRIGGFVRILGPGYMGLMVRDVIEFAFGHVAPADVLVGEDEALLRELLRRAEERPVVLGAVGGDRVGRPLEHDRIGLARILRDVDRGEELRPVPHRDEMLVLDVVGLDVLELLLGQVARGALLGREDTGEDQAQGQEGDEAQRDACAGAPSPR
jgi:hypothetical protein